MKLFKKVMAGFLLAFGIPFSILALSEIVNPQNPPQDREEAFAALIILTLPTTAVGGWLTWSLYKQSQKEISDRLQSTFYRLVKENNGEVTTLRFAMEAQVSGKEARQYLNEKAKEFYANFEALDGGDIAYHFDL